MCFISLDRDNNRLFFDKLFVHLSKLDPEISPFFYNGGRPLVSILNIKGNNKVLTIFTSNFDSE